MDIKLSYKDCVMIRIALKSKVEDIKEICGPESTLLSGYEIVLEKIEDILLKC